MANGDLDTLYKNRKASLWVEDSLTRQYLKAVWGEDLNLAILVAGGTESVRGLTSKARQAGHGCVFGICDRDFGSTNRSRWSATTDVFRLDMHEIENAALHDDQVLADAAAALGGRRDAKAIQSMLATTAQDCSWGMALGATLRWLHEQHNDGFPDSRGLLGVRERDAAFARIEASRWWLDTLPQLGATMARDRVAERLDAEHARFDADVATGAFRRSFAGKALLEHLASWLLQSGHSGARPRLEDLVKKVGELQRATRSVPGEIGEIERCIAEAIRGPDTDG